MAESCNSREDGCCRARATAARFLYLVQAACTFQSCGCARPSERMFRYRPESEDNILLMHTEKYWVKRCSAMLPYPMRVASGCVAMRTMRAPDSDGKPFSWNCKANRESISQGYYIKRRHVKQAEHGEREQTTRERMVSRVNSRGSAHASCASCCQRH